MVGFGRFFCAGGKVENDGELFKKGAESLFVGLEMFVLSKANKSPKL